MPERHRFPMLKYELIPSQLLHEGIVDEGSFFSPSLASFETACLAHASTYVSQLFNCSIDAKMARRIGFPISEHLIQRELYIVDGTIQSAKYALEYGASLNVAGGTHHAGYDFGEGFCLLNDQAVAARYLLREGYAKRILIIDLDVHQGNGTAHIFRNDAEVFTFSMHGDKNFPFIKEHSHWDVALEDSIEDDQYLNILSSSLDMLFSLANPDFVFYQAGVDILSTDKLGKLKVSPTGCKLRDFSVINACRQLDLPLQISMGGGYSPQIKDIVNAHVETFRLARDIYDL